MESLGIYPLPIIILLFHRISGLYPTCFSIVTILTTRETNEMQTFVFDFVMPPFDGEHSKEHIGESYLNTQPDILPAFFGEGGPINLDYLANVIPYMS